MQNTLPIGSNLEEDALQQNLEDSSQMDMVLLVARGNHQDLSRSNEANFTTSNSYMYLHARGLTMFLLHNV
jgi:hypothetical protein